MIAALNGVKLSVIKIQALWGLLRMQTISRKKIAARSRAKKVIVRVFLRRVPMAISKYLMR